MKLSPDPPWTIIPPDKQVVCTWAVTFLHSDSQGAEDPKEQSLGKMIDDDTWFPCLNETRVGTEEHAEGGFGDDEEEGGSTCVWWNRSAPRCYY